jgi:hypothetical protein
MVEKLPCVPAGESKSAHVGDIKHAAASTNLQVLLDDRAVMQWHLPACVVDELRAVVYMEGVKGGLTQRCQGGHPGIVYAISLALPLVLAS